MNVKWTRRTLLERCAAFGVLSVAIPTTLSSVAEAWDAADKKKLQPTPSCELGPFYKRLAPSSANMRTAKDPGMPLLLSGVIFNESGEILPDAKVEVWQTDHFGHYDNTGYRFRATLQSDSKGGYQAESVMPGHYPQRVCQHVHYLVTAPGHKPLTTQLYFGTDPVFDGNPAKNFSRDPLISSVELVRPVMIKGDPKEMIAAVNFDLVLEKR
jgi:protocatechuate 3,4-dioxygenase beta subunit